VQRRHVTSHNLWLATHLLAELFGTPTFTASYQGSCSNADFWRLQPSPADIPSCVCATWTFHILLRDRHYRLTTRRLRKQRLLMRGKHSFKGTNGSHRAQHNDATVLCGRHSRPTQSLPTAEMEGACLIANKPRLNYVQIHFRKCQLLLFSPQFPVLQAAVQKHKDYNLTQSM